MVTLSFRRLGRGMDVGLITAVLLLVLLSLGALFSFSLNVSQPNFTTLYHQLTYVAIGLVAAVVLMRLDYRYFGGIHWVLYAVGILSLIGVYFFGASMRGTRGWFELGGFQLQPVEFMKIIMAIVLARYFATHIDRLQSWSTILISGLITLIPIGLVMLQPDLGSALILFGMWFGMIIILPVPRRVVGVLCLTLCVVAVGSWFLVLKSYQKERILNFVSPSRDQLNSGYNVQQAITAIGSGGLFGRGLGLGPQSQLKFLPERHTDFIFASISEELGLIGGGAIVLLFALFFWRLFRLARISRDNFSTALALAITLMFFIQVAINIGMNLGLFPVTGIPLPLVSYGGSSMLASFLAIGLLESLAIRQRTLPV